MKKFVGAGVVVILIAGAIWFGSHHKIRREKKSVQKNNSKKYLPTSETNTKSKPVLNTPTKTKPSQTSQKTSSSKQVKYIFVPGRQILEVFSYHNVNDIEFKLQTDPKYKKVAPQSTKLNITCKAEMKITCYKNDGHSSFIGYKLQGCSLSFLGNGKPVQLSGTIAKSLQKEIFVEQDLKGNIISIYFPKSHQFAKNLWQQILALRKISFSEKSQKNWFAKEENSIGTYVAKYTMKPGKKGLFHIKKELQKFTSFKYESGQRFAAKDIVKQLKGKQFQLEKFRSLSKYTFNQKIGQASLMDIAEAGKMKIRHNLPINASYETKWNSRIASIKLCEASELLSDLYKRLNVKSITDIKNNLENSRLGSIHKIKKEYSREQKEKARQAFENIMKEIDTLFSAKKINAAKLSKLFRKLLNWSK